MLPFNANLLRCVVLLTACLEVVQCAHIDTIKQFGTGVFTSAKPGSINLSANRDERGSIQVNTNKFQEIVKMMKGISRNAQTARSIRIFKQWQSDASKRAPELGRRSTERATKKTTEKETEKRLLHNLEMNEKKTEKKNCQLVEYACGKKCSGREGKKFGCKYPNHVPRLCQRRTLLPRACSGKPKCKQTRMEPMICERTVTSTEACPGSGGCSIGRVKVGPCEADRFAERCAYLEKKACTYVKKTTSEACQTPRKRCYNCRGSFARKRCKRKVRRQVEVACNAQDAGKEVGAAILERSKETREGMHAANARCLSSFFDERECRKAPRACRLLDEVFDEKACARAVCKQCWAALQEGASASTRATCTDLLTTTCAVALPWIYLDKAVPAAKKTTGQSGKGGSRKCYAMRSSSVDDTCYSKLAANKVCTNGCVMSRCSRVVYEAEGWCKGNPSPGCRRHKQQDCVRKTEVMRLCDKQRVCEFHVRKKYLCFRKRSFDGPCPGYWACRTWKTLPVVCGNDLVSSPSVCVERLQFRCRQLVCTRRRCD